MANSLKIPAGLKKRAAQIELLLMDVDGTMTDGGVTLLSQTEEIALEIKTLTRTTVRALRSPTPLVFAPAAFRDCQSSALLRRAREMNINLFT